MPSCAEIQIVIAPLPEERDVEQSAANEFAVRMAELFGNETTKTTTNVKIRHLAEWDKDEFMASVAPTSSNDKREQGKSVVVFLISCGPDGSVHRSVRKTTKWLKEQQQKNKTAGKPDFREGDEGTAAPPLPTTTTALVALLGHSVCKTSAEQMADEVYSSGRRFAKSIQSLVWVSEQSKAPRFLLETQIELEAPEEKFDGWVHSWNELPM